MNHAPVMLAEVLRHLAPRDGEHVLDGTFGGGGYSAAILEAARCTVWAIDRDPDAIARGAALAARFPGRLQLLQGRFGDMVRAARRARRARAGRHRARPRRLLVPDRRAGARLQLPRRRPARHAHGGQPARPRRTWSTRLGESELADTLYQFGEERLSRRIAKAIVAARAEAPITTTLQLAEIIRRVVPADRSGIDPATRSFQALRIRVNDELGEIERGLAAAAGLLAPGGRLVVVVVPLARGPAGEALHAGSGRPRARRPPAMTRPGCSDRAAPRFALLTRGAERPGRRRAARQSPRPQRPPARARPPAPLRGRTPPMIRPFTLRLHAAWPAASGLYLYQCKHRAQMLDREIGSTVKQTEAARERIGMLRAEWALLNEPDRLAELAPRAHRAADAGADAVRGDERPRRQAAGAGRAGASRAPPAEAEPEEPPAAAGAQAARPQPVPPPAAAAAAQAGAAAPPPPTPGRSLKPPRRRQSPSRTRQPAAPSPCAAARRPCQLAPPRSRAPPRRPAPPVLRASRSAATAVAPGTIGAPCCGRCGPTPATLRRRGPTSMRTGACRPRLQPSYARARPPMRRRRPASLLGGARGALPPPVPFAAR